MPDRSSFPITQRRPASHPEHLQLYAAPTLDGVKVSIMLQEIVDIAILGLNNGSNIQAWLERGPARPAVQRGLHIPARAA